MKQFLGNIRQWFRYVGRYNHFVLIKEALFGYPFDSYYLLQIEQAKMNQMLAYFQASDLVESNDKICRDLRLCIKLNKIMCEEIDIAGRYVNTSNITRFAKPSLIDFYTRNTDQYYILKAQSLYYEIMKQNIMGWWD